MMAFVDILSEINGKTIVHPRALEVIYDACFWADSIQGSVAECGVYKGGSLRLLARRLPGKKVWGFDTFEGMPGEAVRDFDTHKQGDFGDTNFAEVCWFLRDLENVVLVPGTFPETFKVIPDDELFAFIHLDCDQYDSYNTALDYFLPRLVDGGVLVVDDYNHCEGAKRSIDERFPDIEKPPHVMVKESGAFETIRLRRY